MKQAEKGSNQKKLRIVLIVVVAILWTLIFFKVYKTFFSKTSSPEIKSRPTQPKIEKSASVDTFSLKLNYLDPFLKHEVKIPSQEKKNTDKTSFPQKTSATKNNVKQTDCLWEEIIYGGLIKNNEDNKNTALLRIKGKSYVVKENELVKEYMITKVFRDSITIKKENCIKTFYKAL